MRYLAIILAACSLSMISCNNGTETKKEETTTTAPEPKKAPESKLGEAGTGKLMSVVNDYYALKDALVATNAAKADEAAGKLNTSVDTMIAFVKNDSNSKALQPYLDTMLHGAKDIRGIMDETCEKKRVYFEKVSDAMFAVLKEANLKNAGVYRQYCPMAFNEKGAFWLSNESEIKNPYYGKKMLECGEVTDSLK